MKKWILPLLLALFLLLGGCDAQKTYEIVATTAPVWQFASAVCEGTGLEVGLVVSDSVSCLHDYTLSVRQMVAVEKAQVVILSGLGLEAFLGDALEGKEQSISCAGDGVTLLPMAEDHDHGGHGHEEEWDPHIWLDPDNAAAMTRDIAEGLSALYPRHAEAFSQNAEAYCERLSALKEECLQELQDLRCRQLITFHDGFAYFARAFGLEIAAAMEEEAGSEASAKDLKALTELIRSEGIPAVFVEKNGSRAAASILSAETGCGVYVLDTIMSPDSDYFEAIRANVQAVKEAMS